MPNLIVITDVVSRPTARLEGELTQLGNTMRLNAQTWVVNCDSSASKVLRALLNHVGHTDKVFVADCANDQAAWYNFGPEFEARLRLLWKKKPRAVGMPASPGGPQKLFADDEGGEKPHLRKPLQPSGRPAPRQ